MTTSELLAQAELEYHNLMTGLKPRVYVDQNGERIEYTPANAGRLRQYITELKGIMDSSIRSTGPLRPYF
jgi:N-formylglutamate amidohydrolase